MISAMLGRILSLFVGRSTVTPNVIQSSVGTLKGVLKEKNFAGAYRISDQVAMVVIQEALRRASERDEDGQARMNEFYEEIERAADAIIAAFDGDAAADSRIRGILVFHQLL